MEDSSVETSEMFMLVLNTSEESVDLMPRSAAVTIVDNDGMYSILQALIISIIPRPGYKASICICYMHFMFIYSGSS